MAKQTWVYLMKDLRSGFYKIGQSQNPVYRERTLQAEQPLIELHEAWLANISDEKELHRRFAHKRVRGEWFNLEFTEYYEIALYFEHHIRFTSGTTAYEEAEKDWQQFCLSQKREHIIKRFIYA